MKTPQSLKIKELRDKPISYSNVCINDLGQLNERASLLNDRIVEGYGCIWGVRNDYGEIFTRGCFQKSIDELGPGSNSNYQIKFRDSHGKACALFEVLQEDEVGLYFKTKPLDPVQWCNDLLIQLRSGTINNFSNGFKHVWDKIVYNEDTNSMIINEARLFEISAVAIPSDIQTFAIRGTDEPEYLQEDVEDFITSLPRSKQVEARILITRCMSLQNSEPLEQLRAALTTKEPVETGLNYTYLLTNLK